jgi:hypothetical protein
VLEPLPGESLRRLRGLDGRIAGEREAFAGWVAESIAPRNVAGLADPARKKLYPVDLEVLLDRHALLGLDRAQIVEGLPKLRGSAPGDV